MCIVLNIPRSVYYYVKNEKSNDSVLSKEIIRIFRESRQTYGTRRIKHKLKECGHVVSRRRITHIMKEQGLVSIYTVAQFKPTKTACNESEVGNTLNREFRQDQELKVVVSDLTYVRVQQKWHYICLLIDLFNRKIIGFSAGAHKNAKLVQRAFASVQVNLNQLECFHTDRGSEFNNKLIDDALEAFKIKRSLSNKGTPYDNAVAEATFKTIKTEFVRGKVFSSQYELDLDLFDYVHWYNHIRIHGSLGYATPTEYKIVDL